MLRSELKKRLVFLFAGILMAVGLLVGQGIAAPSSTAYACNPNWQLVSMTSNSTTVWDPYFRVWTSRDFFLWSQDDGCGHIRVTSQADLADGDNVSTIQAQVYVYYCGTPILIASNSLTRHWVSLVATAVVFNKGGAYCIDYNNGYSYVNDPGYTGYGSVKLDSGWIWSP